VIAFCQVRFLGRKPFQPRWCGGCGCSSTAHSNTSFFC